jgi:general secretion pathway protein I
MIALAILGLMLTALLSAQAGLYGSNVRARNITVANAAARCKMSEVEEKLLKDGYPEAEQTEEGPCCDGETPTGMTCRWTIERVTLPDPPQTNMDGGVPSPSAGGDGGASGGGFGALAALAGAGQNPGALGDGGVGDLAQMLAGGTGAPGGAAGGLGGLAGGLPGGGVNGIAGMAMTIVYPQLKPLLEASIRRVTVDVVWTEGPNEQKTRIVQFVTNPQKGLPPIIPGMPGGDAGAAVPGAGGMGGTPGAGAVPGGMGPTGMPRFGGM